MAGGQQINSGQGFLGVLGSDVNEAATGSEATLAAGSTGNGRFLPLRSKKVGGGTATFELTGQAVSAVTGSLIAAKGAILTGLSVSFSQGTVLYRGVATLSWNPVTTNSDGTPITDLAGYRILHGTAPGIYSDNVELGIVTTYVWSGLLPGTHYWVVQAKDTANQYSGNSAEVSKTY
jgi:hypothetical protein